MALVRSGNWWERGVPIVGGEASIKEEDVCPASLTSASLTPRGVASESLSANALRRSVVCQVPHLTPGTTSPLTSAFTVWQPSRPVTLTAFSLIAQTSWVQTTLQTTALGTLFACDQLVGTVSVSAGAAPARGQRLAGVMAADVAVGAGVPLTFALAQASSSGMDVPVHALQIDYDSTD